MNNQKILLCMPTHSGIIEAFLEGLKHHGFTPTPFPFEDRDFKYPNVWSRLVVKFQQNVLGKKDAKAKLRLKLLAKKLEMIVSKDHFDHILFIRGDIFPIDALETIKKSLSIPIINYQWDALNRYPKIWNTLPYFDKFYVFDPADLQHQKHLFSPITNFYFDHITPSATTPSIDFYFTGTHQPNRDHHLKKFINYSRLNDLTLDFHVTGSSPELNLYQDYPEINITKTGFSYLDNLKKIQQAKAIVDFKTPAHNGLSFRPFEALGYRKKLITTNTDITRYDFYHPDNIFVWHGNDLDGLKTFMDKPYHEMPSEIYEKYSFGNWIRYILDIHPHHPINLPK